jgi:polyisoprenoid-binding protein YceI
MPDITVQDRLTGTWKFSAVHSTADFSVDYLVASFRGSFRDLSAELFDGNLRGQVDVRSIDVKDENLAAHLMGPDFFDAERHPTIGFESSSLRIDGDLVEIDGKLPSGGNALADQVELTVELEFIRAS